MRKGALLALLFCSWVLLPRQMAAQTVPVRIQISTPSGDPIPGALLALIHPDGRTISEGLTGSSGVRAVTARPGAYRVRVRRIGYRPYLSEPIELLSGRVVSLTIPDDRVTLRSIQVRARARCQRLSTDTARLGLVWSEVTKALQASQLTANDLAGVAEARQYRRVVTDDGSVLVSDSTRLPISDQRPFGAADPKELASRGYVRGDETKGWEFFAPDEAVLLSDDFAATHCFRIVRDSKRTGEIGIAFEPVPDRRLADIAGTLWLDETTAELRELVFRFVNGGAPTRFGASGRTTFRRMPSGAWIVSDWYMRMPRLEMSTGEGIRMRPIGYEEIGGGVIEASVAVNRGKTSGTVSGVVVDSITGEPLRGATVSLDRATASSDSSGRFAFLNAPVGPATLTFTHPSLSRLGVVAVERPIDIDGSETNVVLATPTLRALWLRLCSDSAFDAAVNERGILHGFVTDESGRPVTGADVAIYWTEYRPSPGEGSSVARLSITARTNSEGRYAVCGFRRLVQGTVRATRAREQSERREFSFSPSLVARRDLSFSPAMARPSDASQALRIIVTDSVTGTPLSDATVVVSGRPDALRTDDSGRVFLTTSMPELDVAVRKLGYAEQKVTVRPRDRVTSQARISLAPVQVLSEVRVEADGLLPSSLERRRDQRRGSFIGPEEIARSSDVGSLLARSGAIIGSGGRFLARFNHPAGGECWADIYIDGRLSGPTAGATGNSLAAGTAKAEELGSMSPSAIFAVEVYERASQAPAEFAGVRDGCGVILVWTRGYVEAGMR